MKVVFEWADGRRERREIGRQLLPVFRMAYLRAGPGLLQMAGVVGADPIEVETQIVDFELVEMWHGPHTLRFYRERR